MAFTCSLLVDNGIAKITLTGELDSASAGGFPDTIAEAAAGLDRKASYRLRLAVDEIATNIITHGYADAHIAGDVVVNASIGHDQLIITLEDWAPAFDPRVQEDPDHVGKPSDERPIG